MNTFAAGAPTDAAQKAAAEEELERISGQRFFSGNSLNIYQ